MTIVRHHKVHPLLDGADLHSKPDGGETLEVCATRGGNPHIAVIMKAEADRREAVHMDQCVVLAMGHPERLRAGLRVLWLDAGVVRMIQWRMGKLLGYLDHKKTPIHPRPPQDHRHWPTEGS